ncbi:MAG: penicillin acylase family protein [Rhodospirillaceae bacterium]|nr:penicillin acylase family protein [Rhodospirillaceae bacterium]MYB13557.1 penicillin acylase family protein [Rhodospirillaceae bacterium]MYI49015.1 penicillin acylase family protein [Rhodospirillaceae bacterium]
MIRAVLRWTLRIAATLVLMLAVAGVVMFFWFRTSLPRLDGPVTVAGLEKPVSIVRDRRGIPHIYAGTENDAWFALGYVHAQDRLFQMEMQRRAGQGRLAEIIGPPGLRADRLFRTLGLYRRAQDSVKHLAPGQLKMLEAYAAGVNQWLKTRKGTLPPEFNLTGLEFEPWKPADTLVWGKLMAVRLSTDWRGELLRARIVQKAGKEALPVLFPPYPGDAPVTVGPHREGLLKGVDFGALLAALPAEVRGGGASNVWALGPGRTTTGAAILASDPHLGMNAPVLWYVAHISAPGLTLSGATVPGGPLLIMGHNGHIAWGLTTTYIDTDDVILEKLDPADPNRYMADGRSVPFQYRTETIKVRFGADVRLTIRESRNGPALDYNEELREYGEKNGRVAVLRAPWLSRADTSAVAFAGINKARNWAEFRNALRLFIGPIQNFLYADTAGNIGYLVPGVVPIRKRPGAGWLPQDGADPGTALAGTIPFDSLPQSFNPPGGVLINANNRIAGSDYPYFLSQSWGDHYRAARIAQMLAAKERFTPDEVARMQADHVSLAARATLPLLLKVEPADDRQRRVLDMLKAWDGAMALTRPEPLIYAAWFRELNRRLYADELGEVAKRYVSNRPDVVIGILTKHRQWCDDVGTDATEDCPAILRASLAAALDFLSDRLGDDPAVWRWGDLHYAEMRHQAFGPIPLLGRLTTIRIAANGSRFTVTKAPADFRSGNSYATRQGPGFRGVYDFSDLKKSRFTLSSGQSGNPYSEYYDNLVQEWRDVRHWRLAPDEAAARRGAVGVLTLTPQGDSPETGQ